MNVGKLLGKAVRFVARNPGKIKIAAAVIGVTLPPIAVKGLDLAARTRDPRQ